MTDREKELTECLEMVRSQLFDKNNRNTILTLSIDEVLDSQVYSWHIDVKNNVGVPIKFLGTKSEFNKAYDKYYSSDTYGKIIGEHRTAFNPAPVDDTIINDPYSPNFGKSKSWEEPIEGKINKRYKKYL